tara:strand:- start:462 stop:995 length:534 start_codon:yes stop_codon:yes gene_type:complete
MRGILFTEYLDFASDIASDEEVENLLSSLNGEILGSYTAVGNYSFSEFAKIHLALADHLSKEPNDLARQFGQILLSRFAELFPSYFEGAKSGLDFLEQVGLHIHEEVKKLYPDSNPPDVHLVTDAAGTYKLTYKSHRPLASVARGLTEACLEYFNDPHYIAQETIKNGQTEFVLEKR